MTNTMELVLPCPHLVYNEGEDDSTALPHECGADVVVALEWQEGDSRFGADRDGNRWMAEEGQWVTYWVKRCKKGHELDSHDESELGARAEEKANERR